MSDTSWLGAQADQVLNAVVDAILTIDAAGNICSVNDATVERFGYTREELIGAPVSILMPEPHKSQHQGYVQQFLNTGEERIIGIGRELLAQAKDGHTFPIYLAVSEVAAHEGSRFVGIVRDLSEQKAAQTALVQQRERLSQVARLSTMGEMTASIAHEINQPLTAISMYAQAALQMLNRDNYDIEKLKTALEKLNRQSLRAGDVIERIQRFVRHEDGERVATDINALVEDLQHLAESDARLNEMDLIMDLAPTLDQVLCDPIQIQQVALNLIRNAIDSMREIELVHGREIVVRTSQAADVVEIAVEDSGAGVSEDAAAKLFSAFFTTKSDGMGLGLAICHSIIEEHGGTLSFRNNPGHGATFYFQLPRIAQS